MRFVRQAVLIALVAFAGACSAGGSGSAPYTLGKEYSEVRSKLKSADAKHVKVEEFFWYGCPHCYHLDPEVRAWAAKKPVDVDFVRVPDTLGRADGELHARAFYIAKTMGIGEKIHQPLFAAIHDQQQPMNTLEAIRALFVQVAGIKPADFDGLADSFVVNGDLRGGEELARSYGITSVPAFVVGGEYLVPNQADALKVVDFVVDKVRKEQKR